MSELALDQLRDEMYNMRETYRRQGWTWRGRETLDWLVGSVMRGPFRAPILQDPRYIAYCRGSDVVELEDLLNSVPTPEQAAQFHAVWKSHMWNPEVTQ